MAERLQEKTIKLNNLIGEHEMQFVEIGEFDLSKTKCEKYPRHENFISVDKLELGHLPDGHRDEDLLRIIKAVSDLTVKIEVKMTSPERPDYWPDTDIRYPGIGSRGKTTKRMGTGRMSSAVLRMDKDGGPGKDMNKCWCRKCERSSNSASSSWWEFTVETATHVVFNEEEAEKTILQLFYDTPKSPEVYVDRVGVSEVHIQRDWCRLRCVTCDDTIGEKLMAVWKEFYAVWKHVYRKYAKTRDKDKLAFVVSHPHGCSKQVTVGKWVEMHKLTVKDKRTDLNFNKFTYAVSTCPGSSGAPVYCVGYSGGTYQHVHSGALDKTFNISGACRFLGTEGR